MLGDVDGDQPHQLVDLGGGDPDAAGKGAHRVEQVGGHPRGRRHVVVEGPGHPLERRVGIAEDVADYSSSLSSSRMVTSTPWSRRVASSSVCSAPADSPGGSETSSIIA